MTTITLDIPDDLAELVKDLPPDEVIGALRQAFSRPAAFGPELVAPGLVGSVTTHGDLMEPIDVVWEADR